MECLPTLPGSRDARYALAGRLRLVRIELYGDHGGPMLAARLGLPERTWLNYERGVTIPGEILLEFLVQTGTEPLWLNSGAGGMFRVGTP